MFSVGVWSSELIADYYHRQLAELVKSDSAGYRLATTSPKSRPAKSGDWPSNSLAGKQNRGSFIEPSPEQHLNFYSSPSLGLFLCSLRQANIRCCSIRIPGNFRKNLSAPWPRLAAKVGRLVCPFRVRRAAAAAALFSVGFVAYDNNNNHHHRW